MSPNSHQCWHIRSRAPQKEHILFIAGQKKVGNTQLGCNVRKCRQLLQYSSFWNCEKRNCMLGVDSVTSEVVPGIISHRRHPSHLKECSWKLFHLKTKLYVLVLQHIFQRKTYSIVDSSNKYQWDSSGEVFGSENFALSSVTVSSFLKNILVWYFLILFFVFRWEDDYGRFDSGDHTKLPILLRSKGYRPPKVDGTLKMFVESKGKWAIHLDSGKKIELWKKKTQLEKRFDIALNGGLQRNDSWTGNQSFNRKRFHNDLSERETEIQLGSYQWCQTYPFRDEKISFFLKSAVQCCNSTNLGQETVDRNLRSLRSSEKTAWHPGNTTLLISNSVL